MDEKRDFSERLRAALADRGLDPNGAGLEGLFNHHWQGRPVSRQTVWKWLRGQAIPTQDKLQELAKLVRVDPHTLRYGTRVTAKLRAAEARWDEGAGYVERETFEAFLNLPPAQRKVVREVILTFAKAHKAVGA